MSGSVRVEFYGIPRQRAGRGSLVVEAAGGPLRVSDVLARLAEEFPSLRGECIVGGRLCAGYVANINGEKFLGNDDPLLSDGDSLLLLSADAGG